MDYGRQVIIEKNINIYSSVGGGRGGEAKGGGVTYSCRRVEVVEDSRLRFVHTRWSRSLQNNTGYNRM